MHHDIVKCDTSFRVVPQKSLHQVTCVGVDPIGDGEVDSGYPLVRVAGMFLLEGRVTDKELVQKHTEGPDVDTLVVLAGLDHLRWKVVEGAAHSGSSVAALAAKVAADVGRPPEVSELDTLVKMDEDVLRLQVSVYEVFAVEVFQRPGDLVDVVGGERVTQALQLREGFVELSVCSVLDHKVDVLVVLEPSVERKTVFVQDVGLDFDLADDLLLDVVGKYLLFGHHFQCTYVAAAFLTHTVDLPKLALTQSLPYLEIGELPLSCLALYLRWQHSAASGHAQSMEHIRFPCPWCPRHRFLHRRLFLNHGFWISVNLWLT